MQENFQRGNMSSKVIKKLQDQVDKTIIKLVGRKFRKDPIGGKYSFLTSVLSSAYKRQGTMIEAAIIERLKEANHLDVITEKEKIRVYLDKINEETRSKH